MATRQSWADDFYQVGDLQLTGNHPVWTKDGGYTPAAHLAPGAIVARLNWSVCELDLIMVQSSYDKEDLDYLRADRPANRRGALCRGIGATQSKIQRASVQRRQGGQDASGLLDSVSDLSRNSAGVFSAGRSSRRKLARKRKVLDRVLSGTGTLDEYHRRGRGITRLRPDAGASPEVVADEEGRQVCAGAYSRNEGEKAYRRNAPEDFRSGAAGLPAGNTAENIKGSQRARYEQADKTVCGNSPGGSFDGRTSGKNHRQDHRTQVRVMRRDGRNLPVNHGGGASSWSERGVGKSGSPQRLPLQRESSVSYTHLTLPTNRAV